MNPIFPLNEYVPDGEAHVFGDRVYLYGSHDKENGTRFCEEDYVVYSASIHDLSKWKYHGISYRKSDDPRSSKDKLVDFYAPDACKGNDGRYYLIYFIAGPNAKPFGPLSVAVSSNPEGPFSYLGDIHYPDGRIMKEYLTNDPCLINDHGHIYLYYGWGLNRDFRNPLLSLLYNFVQSKLYQRSVKEIKSSKPAITSCAFIELEEDMLTVKRGPFPVLDSKTSAKKGSEFYQHCFYEAPSIRKFNDLYYLLYSSGVNGELCYATSAYPDHGFRYRGVLISSSDIGYKGNQIPHAFTDTNHGSIEFIDGEYYLFYHRLTRNHNYSRQSCIERLHMESDGSFKQVEVSMLGAEEKPILAKGYFSSAYACNLYKEENKKIKKDFAKIAGENGDYYIEGIGNKSIVSFKYFALEKQTRLTLYLKGDCGEVSIQDGEVELSRIRFEDSKTYQSYSCLLKKKEKMELRLVFFTQGKIDFKGIEFEEIKK